MSPEYTSHKFVVTSLFPKFTLPVWSKRTLKQKLKATPTPLVVLPGSRTLAEQMHIFCGGTHASPGPRQFEDITNF